MNMKFLLVVCVCVLVAAQLTVGRLLAISEVRREYNVQHDLDEPYVQVATEQLHRLFIPMSLKECTDTACQNICRILGFNHGSCVSATTCHCYN